MAITYKKNARNIFVIPFYARFWFWWWLIVVFSALCSTICYFVPSKLCQIGIIGLWSLVAILTIWRAYSLTKSVSKARQSENISHNGKQKRQLLGACLRLCQINPIARYPYISVPNVAVCDSEPSHINVEVEKLAGMYDIEKMTEDINASFRGKLGGYAVTSGIITTDGLTYKFVLEDVATDKTWRPATIKDVTAEKYAIKLQEGLTVRLDEQAHIAVWGKTGSKKTTVLLGMILQLFSMGADIRFIDGKDEFSSFQGFYPAEKIVSDPDDVFEQLEDVLAIIKQRQQIMADEVQKRGKWV